MAIKTIHSPLAKSKTIPTKIIDSLGLVQQGEAFFVSSKAMALHFNKKHKNILQDIERVLSLLPKDFTEPNFAPSENTVATPSNYHGLKIQPMIIDVEIGKGASRKDKAYLLSRDAFFLLAMGFTGKNAIKWKVKYIEAFNLLEQMAIDHIKEQTLNTIGSNVLQLAGQEAVQKIRQECFALYMKMPQERLSLIQRAVAYRKRGFTYKEIGTMLNRGTSSVSRLLVSARTLGVSYE